MRTAALVDRGGEDCQITDLDLQEQIARIVRSQAETDKFMAEQRKLTADGMKFDRERTTLLLTADAAFAGASAVLGNWW